MVGIFKFLFKKKKKHITHIKKELKKKEPSTLIRGIRKNKNPPRERERERERESTHILLGEKIWSEWGKWYQIYTKWNGEKNSQNIRIGKKV